MLDDNLTINDFQKQTKEWKYDPLLSKESSVQKGWLLLEEKEGWKDY